MTSNQKLPNEIKSANGSSSSAEETADMQARTLEARQGINEIIFAALKMRVHRKHTHSRSLPLTIIGGFLGSGKTTLLNHLLAAPHGRHLAVLVNDFGRINIDTELVSSRTKDVINLANGCVCCAVSASLTKTLIELAQREDLPEAIVLEASGIADPSTIAQIALTNPAIRLEGILVMADAETLQVRRDDPLTRRLFYNQLTAADLIVLSKLDLVDVAERTAARDWLADKYPTKPIIEAVKGDIHADVVLGIASTREVQTEPRVSADDHAHAFESQSFVFYKPFDGNRLQALFEALPKSLLRAKGILHLEGTPDQRTIYQRVGDRWSYTPAEPWGEETPHSRLVFIGPVGTIEGSTLAADLEACLVKD